MSSRFVTLQLKHVRTSADGLQDKRFEVTPKTTFEEFESVIKADRRTANIDHDILTLIFERVSNFAIFHKLRELMINISYKIARTASALKRKTNRRNVNSVALSMIFALT